VDALSTLESSIPPGAHDALIHAAQVVFTLDAAAQQVCPECGEGLTEVPPDLLAGAEGALDDLASTLAGGELAGTDVPGSDPTGASQPQQDSGKGDGPVSGLNPPETPIEIPTEIPTEPSDATTDLGGLLPTGGTDTGTGGGGHGGKGGKNHPVDLTPVTDTVNEVVTGVVDGVSVVLNGLAGN
jgi:hypothetical protein